MADGAQRADRKTTQPAPLESSIVARILKWLNSQPGAYAFKVHGGRWGGGQPDIVGSFKGRALALEIKRPGYEATALQLATLKKWEQAGAVAVVAYSLEGVKEILKREGLI